MPGPEEMKEHFHSKMVPHATQFGTLLLKDTRHVWPYPRARMHEAKELKVHP